MIKTLDFLKKYEKEFEPIMKRLKRKKPKSNQDCDGTFLTSGAIISPVYYNYKSDNLRLNDDSLWISVYYNYRHVCIYYYPNRTVRPWRLWIECDEMQYGQYTGEYSNADDLYADLQCKWSKTII